MALALKQNPQVKIADLEIQSREYQQKGAVMLPPATVGFQYGQINTAARDPYFEIMQGLGSIPSHIQRSRVNANRVREAEFQKALTERELTWQVRKAWHQWLYLRQVVKELQQQLSFYANFESRADLQYRLGERSLLEKTLIENNLYELRNNHILRSEDLKQAVAELQYLMVTEQDIVPETDTLVSLVMPSLSEASEHPIIGLLQQQFETRRTEKSLEKSLLFPEFKMGYFRQNISETDIQFKGLQGWTFELAIPLWFRPHQARIQGAKMKSLQAEQDLAFGQQQLNRSRLKAFSDFEKYQRLLSYYLEQGLEQARVIQQTATLQMDAGEIDFFQYLQSMQRYTQTRLQYFETLRNYNHSILSVEYLSE
jgi:cobalt-zinc-cadmium resistance protein CzcA